MAINKKLIHFKNKQKFNEELANGNILETSIVFILDTKEIYTHGLLYDGSKVDLSNIEESIQNLTNNKVDKVSGKGLSTNDYTTTEKNKLGSIAEGAEVNVQSDWNVSDTNSDAYIKNKPSLAEVATSGSYKSLTNKPTIDTALSTTSTNAVQNKAIAAGINAKYTKPSTGIPKTDLASAVLTSLGKADTALQSETDPVFSASAAAAITDEDIENWNSKTSNTGTVTGVKMNGSTKNPSNGVVDLGTVITAHQDISGKLDKTTASNTYATKAELSSKYAFAKVSDGTTTITADTTDDTLTVTAGSGASIALDSTNDKLTISHSDTSTLSGAYGPTANVTGSNNATIVVPQITVDGFGHVTGVTNRTYTSKDTDTKVTSVDNHYTPAEDTTAAINASGGSATNITGTGGKLNVVTGLKRDAKGHIVGVISANIYSTDNNTTYDAATQSAAGLMSANDKKKLDGIATGANNYTYTLPSAGSSLGGVKSGGDVSISDGIITVSDDSHNHIISNVDGLQDALDTKAPIASPTFTGTPKAPTATKGTNTTQVATTAFVQEALPTALKNPNTLTIGSQTYDGSSKVTITAADLGLSSALKYHGTTTTALTDGATTKPIVIGGSNHNQEQGYVVAYNNSSFVWDGSKWEELGNPGNYKVVQSAVSSPSASGNATAFIDTISLDANGKITATKKNVQFPTALKNPTALKFGTKSYDGSSELTITAADLGALTQHLSLASYATLNWVSSNFNKYVLPTAASATLGGIKTGYNESGKNYKVLVDTNGNAFVAVPWSWRGITNSVSTSSSDISASATAVKSAYDKAVSAYNLANGKTSNTGTVTSVATGAGLTGGTITGSGTLKAALKSETKSTLKAAAMGSTASRQYAVGLDKNGILSVNVPWTNTTYTSLKNPNSLTVQYNGTTAYSYDGSAAKTLNIKAGSNITVSGDSSGNITINGTPNTTYSAGSGLVLSGTTFSADGSAIINALGEGTSAALADDYIVAQYAGGGTTTTTYHRRKLSNIFKALTKSDITTALGYTPPTTNTTYTFSNANPTLAWGKLSTIGTVGGVNLTVTMPANPNSDTHWTTGINAGKSGAVANSAVTNPYVTVKDNSTYRSQIRLVGGGATTISSDANGNITINSNNTWRGITDSVSTTSSDTSASASAVKTAYDLANSKWTYNANTIKAIKVNTASTADVANSVNWTNVNNKPTNLSQFTDDVVAGKYLPLSGGTIIGNVVWKAGTGNSSILPGHIYRQLFDDTGNVYDHYCNGSVGFNTFANLRVWSNDDKRYKDLRFGGDGTFTWDGKTVIHSGNIGSQSVNYATSAGSCTGNAATATKLQTARTIFGQSFDGTGNVEGDSKANSFIATSSNGLRLAYGNYGTLLRNDGSGFFILLTNSGGALDGSFNTLRPFKIDLATGDIQMESNVFITKSFKLSKRLRVDARESATSFGYLKSNIANATNIGIAHLGTNYGGTSDMTREDLDMTAISMYRGIVGIGKEYDYTSLRAIYDAGVDLGLTKGLLIGSAKVLYVNNELNISTSAYINGNVKVENGNFIGNLTGTADNSNAVNGIKIAIVTGNLPSSPDSSTLYFVK